MMQTGIQQKKSVSTILVSLFCNRLFLFFLTVVTRELPICLIFVAPLEENLLNLSFIRNQSNVISPEHQSVTDCNEEESDEVQQNYH